MGKVEAMNAVEEIARHRGPREGAGLQGGVKHAAKPRKANPVIFPL
jgi:hypothetical protein